MLKNSVLKNSHLRIRIARIRTAKSKEKKNGLGQEIPQAVFSLLNCTPIVRREFSEGRS